VATGWRLVVATGIGGQQVATSDVRVASVASWGVDVDVVACVGASWRSDVAVFNGGQRVVGGGSSGDVASGVVGDVVTAGVGSRTAIVDIDGGRRAATGGVVLLLLVMHMLLVLLVVGVLHVGFLHLLVLFGGRVHMHLLVDIELLMVGRLVVLRFMW
jgi:hypothetical protein